MFRKLESHTAGHVFVTVARLRLGINSGVETMPEYHFEQLCLTALTEQLSLKFFKAPMISRIKTWLASRLSGDSNAEKMRTMLFDRSPLPQAIITRSGIYLDANTAYCALHAVERADLLGKSLVTAGFATPDEQAALLQVFQQQNWHLEGHALKYPTGNSVLYASVFAHSITIREYSGILVLLHDISKQRLAEEAGKRVQVDLMRARFSITHATISILWISKKAEIVDCNPTFCQMLLYRREELLALRIPDIDPDYPAEDWPMHWESVRQNKVLTLLTKHRRKDGKVLDVEVRAHYLEVESEEFHCAFVSDVTERLQSEEQSRTSHRFMQAILNNIPDGVFWKDRESKYLGGNTFFMTAANCKSQEDFLGKTDFDLPWVEQADKLRADDREVMEKNASKLYYVEPLRNADGKVHYNLVSKVPLLDDRARVMGVLGMFRDITDQMEIELALKESEKLFKSVVQNASAIIFIIDQQGIFRLSEGLGLAALGLKPGEILGKSVFDLYENVPEITASIRSALRGEIVENEISIYGITFSTRYAPMHNDTGEISGILCVSFDISSRKKLEEELNKLNGELAQHVNELKESELKFRQIIQSSPMGIYVYEVDSAGKLVMADTNASADAITGMENQKLIGKTIEDAFPGLELTEMPSRFLDAAVNSTPWAIEDFHFNNGSINGIFELYAFQAGRNRVAVMFQNISERRQIEAAIKLKNEELLKTNAELDRFVYSASHDLRAPISSLLGLIAVARAEKDFDSIGLLLNMQERSLHKLDNFIQDIVSYSRNNRVDIEVAPIDFQFIIEGIFEQLHHMEDLDKIERRISIPPDMKFSSDEKRISIILNNLISNAIKYSDLRKDHSFVEVSVSKKGKGVTVCVSDNGEGISKEHLPRIFEMFFRATSRSTGSGIGLYIVNEMVNKMQGGVEVKSDKGEGCQFLIWLPDLAS